MTMAAVLRASDPARDSMIVSSTGGGRPIQPSAFTRVARTVKRRVPRSEPLAAAGRRYLGRARFELDRLERAGKYRNAGFATTIDSTVGTRLEQDGYAIIEQAFDPRALADLRATLDSMIDAGVHLKRVALDSARRPDDASSPTTFLTDEQIALGPSYFRNHTNYVAIADPLYACPQTVPLAFDSLLIDTATAYLHCLAAVGGVNLRKSFANELGEFDTLQFHSDRNSAKFLKFFLYLNDVDRQGGPLCYVRGSHRKKFAGWRKKYRWTPDEIEKIYGAENIKYLTARAGDLVIADTTGFHRGTKVLGSDRSMLTVYYLVHPEFSGNGTRFRIRASDYDSLSAKQKAAADFLEVVSDAPAYQ